MVGRCRGVIWQICYGADRLDLVRSVMARQLRRALQGRGDVNDAKVRQTRRRGAKPIEMVSSAVADEAR